MKFIVTFKNAIPTKYPIPDKVKKVIIKLVAVDDIVIIYFSQSFTIIIQ